MSTSTRVYPEYFPYDLRFVDSFVNVVVPSSSITPIILHVKDELPKYNANIVESLLLANWVVRRILTELSLTVLEFEPNSDYEEFFEQFFEESEKFVFLNSIRTILKEKQFEPTMVQAIVAGQDILLSFGATNVHNFKAGLAKTPDK